MKSWGWVIYHITLWMEKNQIHSGIKPPSNLVDNNGVIGLNFPLFIHYQFHVKFWNKSHTAHLRYSVDIFIAKIVQPWSNGGCSFSWFLMGFKRINKNNVYDGFAASWLFCWQLIWKSGWFGRCIWLWRPPTERKKTEKNK